MLLNLGVVSLHGNANSIPVIAIPAYRGANICTTGVSVTVYATGVPEGTTIDDLANSYDMTLIYDDIGLTVPSTLTYYSSTIDPGAPYYDYDSGKTPKWQYINNCPF